MNGYPITAFAHEDLEARREAAARERLARRLGTRSNRPGTPASFSLVGTEVFINREGRHACSPV